MKYSEGPITLSEVTYGSCYSFLKFGLAFSLQHGSHFADSDQF